MLKSLYFLDFKSFRSKFVVFFPICIFILCSCGEAVTESRGRYVTTIGDGETGATIAAKPGSCTLGEIGRTEFSSNGKWIANYVVKDDYQKATFDFPLSTVAIISIEKNQFTQGLAWSNVRPLSWSRISDSFYVSDINGNLLMAKGALNASNKMDDAYAVIEKKFRSMVESYVLLGGANGFAIFRSKKARTLFFLDLDDAASEIVELKAHRGRFVDYGVQCSSHQKCIVFGEAEDWSKEKEFPVRRRDIIFKDREAGVQQMELSAGSEIDFIGWLRNGQIAFLARGANFRQLVLTEPKKPVTEVTVNPKLLVDLKSARLVSNGTRIIVEDFFGQTSLVTQDGNLISDPSSNQKMFKTIDLNGDNSELQYLKFENELPRLLLKKEGTKAINFSCSSLPSRAGVPLSTTKSNAVLHRASITKAPAAGSKRPLILKFHGGPYTAESAFESESDEAFLALGMDVMDVNYPGTPGYGTQYVMSGKQGTEQSLSDALDLIKLAEQAAGYSYSAIAVLGGSFGSLHALSANKNVKKIDLRVVLNPFCPKIEEPDFDRSTNPFQAWIMHLLQPSSQSTSLPSCGGSDVGDVMIFVSKNDDVVSPETGKRIAALTPRSELFVLEGEGHTPSSRAWKEIAATVYKKIKSIQLKKTSGGRQ